MITQPDPIKQKYDRWFNRVHSRFSRTIEHLAGQPVTYVEIGCWAGASAEWTARHILTHPQSRGIGIDPYLPDKKHDRAEVEFIRQMAQDRLAFMGERWQWIIKPSQVALRNLPYMIDILYVDGAHNAEDVLQDFVLAWPLLKQGSIVIFDDYSPKRPPAHPHVRDAYECILYCFEDLVKQIGKRRRQAAIQVLRKNRPV